MADGDVQYYYQDGIGSVLKVEDQNGGFVGSRRYDAWGNVISSLGTIPLYGYTGREPDATGLIYYRARYYDPEIGRFVQRDPSGFADGVNLYLYARNNPATFNDPLGLAAQDPTVQASQEGQSSYFGNSSSSGGTSNTESQSFTQTSGSDLSQSTASETSAAFGSEGFSSSGATYDGGKVLNNPCSGCALVPDGAGNWIYVPQAVAADVYLATQSGSTLGEYTVTTDEEVGTAFAAASLATGFGALVAGSGALGAASVYFSVAAAGSNPSNANVSGAAVSVFSRGVVNPVFGETASGTLDAYNFLFQFGYFVSG